MKITDVLIFVTKPGAEPVLVNTASRELLAAGYPSSIESISLAWSRPAGYAHQGAANASLTLFGDGELVDLLEWDSRVDILAVVEGDPAPWRILFVGWITETSRRRRGKLFEITVNVVNVIGRAAGTRLGDKPWPAQDVRARLTAINAASPVGPLAAVSSLPWDKQLRAALDVDSRPALDIIEASLDPTSTLEESADGLIHAATSVGTLVSWPTATSNLAIAGIVPSAIKLPASAVHDAPRVANRTGLVTHVTIEAKSPSTDAPKPGELPKYDTNPQTWSNDKRGRQSAEHRITTDAIIPAGTPFPPAWVKYAQGLNSAGANPGERIESGKLIASRLEPLTFGTLTGIDTRAGTFLELADATEDVEISQRPIAGRLTIAAGSTAEGDSAVSGLRFNRLPARAPKRLDAWQTEINSHSTMNGARVELELELEPTRLSGVDRFRFNEIPDSAYITFNRAEKATIAQLSYVNRVLAAPPGATRASRRFLQVASRAALNQTTATIAEYSYLNR